MHIIQAKRKLDESLSIERNVHTVSIVYIHDWSVYTETPDFLLKSGNLRIRLLHS